MKLMQIILDETSLLFPEICNTDSPLVIIIYLHYKNIIDKTYWDKIENYCLQYPEARKHILVHNKNYSDIDYSSLCGERIEILLSKKTNNINPDMLVVPEKYLLFYNKFNTAKVQLYSNINNLELTKLEIIDLCQKSNNKKQSIILVVGLILFVFISIYLFSKIESGRNLIQTQNKLIQKIQIIEPSEIVKILPNIQKKIIQHKPGWDWALREFVLGELIHKNNRIINNLLWYDARNHPHLLRPLLTNISKPHSIYRSLIFLDNLTYHSWEPPKPLRGPIIQGAYAKNRIDTIPKNYKQQYTAKYKQIWQSELDHLSLPLVQSKIQLIHLIKKLGGYASPLLRVSLERDKKINIKKYHASLIKLSQQLASGNNTNLYLSLKNIYYPTPFNLPIKVTKTYLLSQIKKTLALHWHASVINYFNLHLKPFYPFTPSSQNLPIAIYEHFFDSAGILSQNILAYNNLSIKSPIGIKSQPSAFEFSIKILPNPNLASSSMTILGKKITYYNGPEEWIDFDWPGNNISVVDSAFGLDKHNHYYSSGIYHGPWGLFRLFQTAHYYPINAHLFVFTFYLKNYLHQQIKLVCLVKFSHVFINRSWL